MTATQTIVERFLSPRKAGTFTNLTAHHWPASTNMVTCDRKHLTIKYSPTSHLNLVDISIPSTHRAASLVFLSAYITEEQTEQPRHMPQSDDVTGNHTAASSWMLEVSLHLAYWT